MYHSNDNNELPKIDFYSIDNNIVDSENFGKMTIKQYVKLLDKLDFETFGMFGIEDAEPSRKIFSNKYQRLAKKADARIEKERTEYEENRINLVPIHEIQDCFTQDYFEDNY